MKNQLIADAGSTKTDWVIIGEGGEIISKTGSDGLNAILTHPGDVENAFREVKSRLADVPVTDIHYYGAGCATETLCRQMEETLRHVWGGAEVTASSDLLGAARALFGRSSGIACILGTGSNSCMYDGEKITANVPSLGYVLGDEGSGAALGKRLVSDAFKGMMPEPTRERFMEWSQLSLEETLHRVYRSKAPNKFLASLVPFIKDNIWDTYLYSTVLEELTLFFKRNVALYTRAHPYPVSFIGAIAANFANILREAANSQGFSIGKVISSPMEGLIEYHAAR